MTKEETENLVKDVFTILTSDHYKGRIVKTDLIRELRQNWMWSYVKLSYRWSFSAQFINSDLEDILSKSGVSIEQTNKGRFYFLPK